jgi:hypothetical protein
MKASLFLVESSANVALELLDAIAARAKHDVQLCPLIGREIQVTREPFQQHLRRRAAGTGTSRAATTERRTAIARTVEALRTLHPASEQQTGGRTQAEHGEHEERKPDSCAAT